MPYGLEYIDQGRGVLRVASGRLLADEIIASDLRLLAHVSRLPKAERPRYALIDMSAVTEVAIASGDAHRIIDVNERLATYLPIAHLAMVCTRPDVLMVLVQLQATGRRLRWISQLFDARATAEAWLDEVAR
jgi:hypothetical protein